MKKVIFSVTVFAFATLSINAQIPRLGGKKQGTNSVQQEVLRRKAAAEAAERAEAEAKKNEKTPQQIMWEKNRAADEANWAEMQAQENIKTNTDPSLPKLQIQTTDLKQVEARAEEIRGMATAKRNYQLEKVIPRNPSKWHTHRIIYSENGSEAENAVRLKVEYTALMEGANPALEIEGTLTYRLKSVEGKFLDVLPFWQKYFDATGNIDEMVKTGGAGRYKKKIDGYEYTFQAIDNDGMWRIINF